DRSWLSAELTGSALLEVLAVGVWLAWAHVVVCLAVEVIAERPARSLAPRVPGGGVGTQMLARKLVGTIVLVVGSATMSISSAAAATGTDSSPDTAHHDVSRIAVVSGAETAPAVTEQTRPPDKPA